MYLAMNRFEIARALRGIEKLGEWIPTYILFQGSRLSRWKGTQTMITRSMPLILFGNLVRLLRIDPIRVFKKAHAQAKAPKGTYLAIQTWSFLKLFSDPELLCLGYNNSQKKRRWIK